MVCYDIKNDKWFNGIPMMTSRTSLSVVCARGLIFAIGGFNISTTIDIVEVFHIKARKWLPYSSSLQVPRFANSSVYDEVSDKIYVIGGWNSVEHFNSVEVLDLKHPENGFQLICEMNCARSELTAVCLNGKIYAIGGYDNNKVLLSSVEMYDPETNKWHMIAPMMFERGWPSATVINGKIYVCGGRSKSGTMLSSIEIFDPENGIWSISENMLIARDGHQIISYDIE